MNLNKISVVIRNKNQDESLRFLLRNLNERYSEDIDLVQLKAENIGDPSKPTWVIPKATLSTDIQERILKEQKNSEKVRSEKLLGKKKEKNAEKKTA